MIAELSAQQIMHGTGFVGTFPFLSMGPPQLIVDVFEVDSVLDAIEQPTHRHHGVRG
jgi:hypothetical protein